MKTLFASLALATLAFTSFTPAAHADAMSDGINVSINGAAVVGVYNPLLHEYVFTDTIVNAGVLGQGGLLTESISTITGTYTDVTGILGNLAVVDVCQSLTVLGTTSSPCSNVSVVATATGLTGLLSAETLTLVGLDITLLPDGSRDLGLVTVALGSTSGSLDFTPPPPPPAGSPVPEPGTLSLMATGLVGAAGAVRRKFMA